MRLRWLHALGLAATFSSLPACQLFEKKEDKSAKKESKDEDEDEDDEKESKKKKKKKDKDKDKDKDDGETADPKPDPTSTNATGTTPPQPSGGGQTDPTGQLTIDKSEYGKVDAVKITYKNPIRSVSGDQSWITIAPMGSPDSGYGLSWHFVKDGVTSDSLMTPGSAGKYEIRLHTNYPKLQQNVVARLPLTVSDSVVADAVTMTLDKSSYNRVDTIRITFGSAVPSVNGNQAWITVAPKGSAESGWGLNWHYVKDGATSDTLPAPGVSGSYEVRLHTKYPKLQFNVVARQDLTVQ